jgi:hypothetical protein
VAASQALGVEIIQRTRFKEHCTYDEKRNRKEFAHTAVNLCLSSAIKGFHSVVMPSPQFIINFVLIEHLDRNNFQAEIT